MNTSIMHDMDFWHRLSFVGIEDNHSVGVGAGAFLDSLGSIFAGSKL